MGAYYYHQIYSGPVWHVSTSGDDSNSGRSTSPFATIQQGIDAASDGDTVIVYPGTYVENINLNGKNIVVGSLFLTTQDTSNISSTIIDGNQSGSVVRFENDETSSAVLSGFTITNGYAQGTYPADCGGGIYCSSSPTLTDLVVTGNIAPNNGGGISIYNSDPTLVNVTVSNNTSDYQGGGIDCWSFSHPTLTNCIISGNTAMYGGGIRFNFYSTPTLTNVTVVENISAGGSPSAGIDCSQDVNMILVNSIIWGNSPQEITFSSVNEPCYLTVAYSDIQGGESGIVTNDNGTVTWLEGNIDIYPNFVDTSSANFHLEDVSPCIGAGTNSFQIDGTWYYAPTTDIDGNPRPNPTGSKPDMGAYENFRATPIDTIPPAIPQNLVITDYLQTITLKWNASVNTDLSHYNIYRASSPDFSADSIYFKGKIFAPDTIFTDSLIQNNTTYYYQVTAVDTTGNESDPSDELVITAIVVDIRDIAFQQRVDGSGLVDIYYSFSGHDTTHYEVIPHLSNFNDEAWGKLIQVSGDAGAVLPGDSRQITWNLKSEAPEIYSNNSTIKIKIGLPSKGNQYNPLNEAKIQIEGRIER